MTVAQKITRVMQTRKGSVPTNPNYGSRLYLLRDRRASEVAVFFAKYAHEDIEVSEPTIKVKRANLIQITNEKLLAKIELFDDSQVDLEVTI